MRRRGRPRKRGRKSLLYKIDHELALTSFEAQQLEQRMQKMLKRGRRL